VEGEGLRGYVAGRGLHGPHRDAKGYSPGVFAWSADWASLAGPMARRAVVMDARRRVTGSQDPRTLTARDEGGVQEMSRISGRRVPITVAAAALIALASTAGAVAARPPSAPGYQVANVGPYGGEPSIVSDTKGRLYDTTPQGGAVTYASGDAGRSWQQVTTADANSGDDCLATDQANAVYLCNLAGSEGVAPLQADVWKSVDGGTSWTHGAGALPECATSCSPF